MANISFNQLAIARSSFGNEVLRYGTSSSDGKRCYLIFRTSGGNFGRYFTYKYEIDGDTVDPSNFTITLLGSRFETNITIGSSQGDLAFNKTPGQFFYTKSGNYIGQHYRNNNTSSYFSVQNLTTGGIKTIFGESDCRVYLGENDSRVILSMKNSNLNKIYTFDIDQVLNTATDIVFNSTINDILDNNTPQLVVANKQCDQFSYPTANGFVIYNVNENNMSHDLYATFDISNSINFTQVQRILALDYDKILIGTPEGIFRLDIDTSGINVSFINETLIYTTESNFFNDLSQKGNYTGTWTDDFFIFCTINFTFSDSMSSYIFINDGTGNYNRYFRNDTSINFISPNRDYYLNEYKSEVVRIVGASPPPPPDVFPINNVLYLTAYTNETTNINVPLSFGTNSTVDFSFSDANNPNNSLITVNQTLAGNDMILNINSSSNGIFENIGYQLTGDQSGLNSEIFFINIIVIEKPTLELNTNNNTINLEILNQNDAITSNFTITNSITGIVSNSTEGTLEIDPLTTQIGEITLKFSSTFDNGNISYNDTTTLTTEYTANVTVINDQPPGIFFSDTAFVINILDNDIGFGRLHPIDDIKVIIDNTNAPTASVNEINNTIDIGITPAGTYSFTYDVYNKTEYNLDNNTPSLNNTPATVTFNVFDLFNPITLVNNPSNYAFLKETPQKNISINRYVKLENRTSDLFNIEFTQNADNISYDNTRQFFIVPNSLPEGSYTFSFDVVDKTTISLDRLPVTINVKILDPIKENNNNNVNTTNTILSPLTKIVENNPVITTTTYTTGLAVIFAGIALI